MKIVELYIEIWTQNINKWPENIVIWPQNMDIWPQNNDIWPQHMDIQPQYIDIWPEEFWPPPEGMVPNFEPKNDLKKGQICILGRFQVRTGRFDYFPTIYYAQRDL